jgi:hypothetical protein
MRPDLHASAAPRTRAQSATERETLSQGTTWPCPGGWTKAAASLRVSVTRAPAAQRVVVPRREHGVIITHGESPTDLQRHSLAPNAAYSLLATPERSAPVSADVPLLHAPAWPCSSEDAGMAADLEPTALTATLPGVPATITCSRRPRRRPRWRARPRRRPRQPWCPRPRIDLWRLKAHSWPGVNRPGARYVLETPGGVLASATRCVLPPG